MLSFDSKIIKMLSFDSKIIITNSFQISYDWLVQFTFMTQSRLSHSSVVGSTLNFFYRVDSVTGSDFNGWHH